MQLNRVSGCGLSLSLSLSLSELLAQEFPRSDLVEPSTVASANFPRLLPLAEFFLSDCLLSVSLGSSETFIFAPNSRSHTWDFQLLAGGPREKSKGRSSTYEWLRSSTLLLCF